MRSHSLKRKYSQLSNADLDDLITQFKKQQPELRIWYIVGFLQQYGVHVQHHHIVQSLHCIDHLGQVLHNHQVKCRCQYCVKHSNALWHLGSHHKLIKWGIIIHGVIDEFCRMVGTPFYLFTHG